MPSSVQSPAPEFRDWSVAAVRLLQGIIYSDDVRTWDIVLRSRSQLEKFLSRSACSWSLTKRKATHTCANGRTMNVPRAMTSCQNSSVAYHWICSDSPGGAC